MRKIQKIAVLGSGIMGSGIACHFANIGIPVLLLDIIPNEINDTEKANGKTLFDSEVRNRLVNNSLKNIIASKPSPLYLPEFANRIKTGNFDDNFKDIADFDWIIEAVVERLDIKIKIFQEVEKWRKPHSIVSTNTSGIPIKAMIHGRSTDFNAHFCGTHFFNPPRYLQLFEIIPSPYTAPEVTQFLQNFATTYLGKTAVLANDTPAFIANRIGTFAIMQLFHAVEKLNLSIEDIDNLTGTIIGRAKSATFRTCDLVGLDTLAHVANGLKQFTNDECNHLFELPEFLTKLLENNYLGEKSKQGFYKKIKDGNKRSIILSLNLKTFEYLSQTKTKFESFNNAKAELDLRKRIEILFSAGDAASNFYHETFLPLFCYASKRIPEITDSLYKIDLAMNAGFGWKLGPFETWDSIGLERSLHYFEKIEQKPAEWVYEMIDAGCKSFYRINEGKKQYYNIETKSYCNIAEQENIISLEVLKFGKTIWKNNDCRLIDLGDGVVNLEFHNKMNTIGEAILSGINKAVEIAEAHYKALIIANEGDHFSAGANVGMLLMLIEQERWQELENAILCFQNTMMRLRYSSIPTIAAPHGLTLGGGCELCMHTDKVIAHAETYIGLVEAGIGVIPGGGGSKEFALRISDDLHDGDARTNLLTQRFLTIGQAKVSSSAYEAFKLGYLRKGIDEVIISRANQLKYAKNAALLLAEKGYSQPLWRTDIKVLGIEGLAMALVGADSYFAANYMSEHDKLITEKLGFVLCGGNISVPLTEVTEKYLLNIERQAFIELCKTKKTLERMQSFVSKGKILRN